jgi:hypothetical protein
MTTKTTTRSNRHLLLLNDGTYKIVWPDFNEKDSFEHWPEGVTTIFKECMTIQKGKVINRWSEDPNALDDYHIMVGER